VTRTWPVRFVASGCSRNNQKGFGFIQAENSSKSVFVHIRGFSFDVAQTAGLASLPLGIFTPCNLQRRWPYRFDHGCAGKACRSEPMSLRRVGGDRERYRDERRDTDPLA